MTGQRKLRAAVLQGVAIASALMASVVVSQAPLAADRTGSSAAVASAAPQKAMRPYWVELSPAQQQALAPLAGEWEKLDGQHKKKWLVIGNRYPKMKPEEQQRTQERMREWARLTPEQRRVARDSFARVQALPPEKRAEMLQKYQELPAERKEALAVQGQAVKGLIPPKPVIRPSPRRTQIREGATMSNPAVAAQKARVPGPPRAPAEPVAAPATPVAAPASMTIVEKPPAASDGTAPHP